MTVSVIILTTGSEEQQWRTRLVLESLLDQETKPLEVVVVDGVGTCDGMARVTYEFVGRLPLSFRKLEPSPRPFRAAEARNLGVATLTQKPDRILFLDGDCVADPGLIRTHNLYRKKHIVAAARVHVNPNDLNLAKPTIKQVFSAKNTRDKRDYHPENWSTQECCYTCNLSMGYELFQKIGGFWERVGLGEDREMAMRAIRAGGEVVFLSVPSVYHLDHPVWRPIHRDTILDGDVTYDDSVKMPGYIRPVPDMDKIDSGTVR